MIRSLALLALLALVACNDASEAVAQPTPDQINDDIEFFQRAYRPGSEDTDAYVRSVFDRVEAFPALYLAVVDRRLVHPTTVERLANRDSINAYVGLLDVAGVASEEVWLAYVRQLLDVSLASFDQYRALMVSLDGTDPQWRGAAGATSGALELARMSFRILEKAEDPYAVPAAWERWQQPDFYYVSLAYLDALGIDPRVDAPTCLTSPATVYVASGRVIGGPLDGQPYAGRLVGSEGDDVIVGTGAPDVIEGLGGNDFICGGADGDAIDGGKGTDTVDGGAGTDGCDAIETATACEGAIPILTTVTPIAECVVSRPDGSYTAYFGYENLSGQVGRVPYGPKGSDNNRVAITDPSQLGGGVGSVIEEASPVLFALPGVVSGHRGQTPPFPGFAFSVDAEPSRTGETICDAATGVCYPVGPIGTVSWMLLGETANIDRAPECPAP
ncbi:MAG TPA: hypothetical protein VGB53_02615 [Rubricoccaceae bacterium]|jgi:hypothetical protein